MTTCLSEKMRHYDAVRPKIRVGDMIAWGGKGEVSNLIKSVTNGPVSHVSAVLETKVAVGAKDADSRIIEQIEATMMDVGAGPAAGVQRNRLSRRIESYHGQAWVLYLDDVVREVMDWEAYVSFMLDQEGKPYDTKQAIKSALDLFDSIPFLRVLTKNPQDFSKLFCSELYAGGINAGGGMTGNASEMTPMDLVRFPNLWSGYTQLCGESEILPVGRIST